MKKTIFITSFHILISRNILATGILPLLAKRNGVQVVILCPKKKEGFFRKEFEKAGVLVEPVSVRLNWRDFCLRFLSLASLRTKTLWLKRRTEMKGVGAVFSELIPAFLASWLTRRLSPFLTPQNRFQPLLEKYQPELIFATDVQNEYDVSLMHEARKRGVKIVGMVRSWDNLAAKGLLRIIPALLLANNELVKREAMALHGVPAEKIQVVGLPHYDNYFQAPKLSRLELAEKLGLNAAKKFVLFVPVGDRYLTDNFVDKNALTLLDKILPGDWEISVRLPPADSVKEIEGGNFSERVKIYRPGGYFGNVKNTELSRIDDEILIASIKYSDLIVAGPSTMVIDAAIADKPIILVGFDGKENASYFQSVRRYYDYNHFQPILESGGAPLARSEEEFEKLVRAYLADQTLDWAGRRRIVELECQFTDGQSSQRVVEELEKFL
ncbi:MAG: CDP-glycerol glycerophosphotransferase family protein [Patescibacteria group bacterium]